MPAFKWTMRFKYLSGSSTAGAKNIPGGWTESVYWTDASDGARRGFLRLAQKRAAFLPNFCAITGIRVQQVDPSAAAALQRVQLPGQSIAAYSQDVPQVAALLSIPASGRTNVRRYRAAALPDDWVLRGEFTPGAAFVDFMLPWIRELNGWLMRGADLTKPKIPIKTIGADGTYELAQDLVILPTATVTVYNAVDAAGKKHTAKFKLNAVTNSKQGQLRGWTFGACTLGDMREYAPVYPPMDTSTVTLESVDVVIRKIGRPFVKYVGRRSRRRS